MIRYFARVRGKETVEYKSLDEMRSAVDREERGECLFDLDCVAHGIFYGTIENTTDRFVIGSWRVVISPWNDEEAERIRADRLRDERRDEEALRQIEGEE